MNFICQLDSIEQLSSLAKSNRQSLLIEGPKGSGKTYLGLQYAKMLKMQDIQIIAPKVDDIRQAVETCIAVSQPIVLIIENLDTGVPAASYALLKFLEEPLPNVYIVVTCINLRNVPDTIISRSAVVSVSPPIDRDIVQYASTKNFEAFERVKSKRIWQCVRTFSDADLVMGMTPDQLAYYDSLDELKRFTDNVSNTVWKLGHYPNNAETPVELVIRYLMNVLDTNFARQCGIECIRELTQGRIAAHAILSKFVFKLKYWE